MPTVKTVKFNSILNIWEHWVIDAAYKEGGYWAVGMMGNDQIHSPTVIMSNDTYTSANIIDSIEDIEYTRLKVPIYKTIENPNYNAPEMPGVSRLESKTK